ncbi:MAG: hypothetical protein ACREQ2_27820 [Candidatus Binatia bacterium]
MNCKKCLIYAGGAVLLTALAAAPSVAQEKKAAKAKAEKITGDIGLLDTEKNYMIVVTKDGKLVTIDYNAKTKVTAMVPGKAKINDIGLGSAASVQYTEKGGKNYLTAIEYIAKKGGE